MTQPYRYGQEPGVEVSERQSPPLGYAEVDIKPTGEMVVKKSWVEPGIRHYSCIQRAIVHGTELVAMSQCSNCAEAYKDTIDSFNLGLKVIAGRN